MCETMYGSRAIESFKIEKEVYDYLLPIYGKCANKKSLYPMIEETFGNSYFFYGTSSDIKYMLEQTEIIRAELKTK